VTKLIVLHHKNKLVVVVFKMNIQDMVSKSIKYVVGFCLIALFSISDIVAQNIKSRSDLDKKSLKTFKEAIKEGRKKRYQKSLEMFNKVLKKHPEFIDAQLRKAGMLHNMKKYELSANEFEKAIEMAPEYDPQMYFSLAIVNRDLDRFVQAAKYFQLFIDRTKNEKKKLRAIDFRDRSLFTHNAMAKPVPFNPVLLEDGVRSRYSEYAPLMNIEGDEMIFIRKVNGQEDFFVAYFDKGEIVEVKEMKGLNTPDNESVATLSADGNILIFTTCDRRLTGMGSCDLYYSIKNDDGWDIPSNMGKIINSISWDGQPSLSSDGKKLFFSSGRQDGFGGNDIWMSTRTDTSGWGIPNVLPDVINTSGNEESPFIHPDGHTLYFRSNKHIGMGDFDIFYTRFIDSTNTWTLPTNIGYPINTEGNEGALSVSLDGKKAYYTSDMAYLNDRANANLDIYSFDLYHDAQPMPTTFVKAKITDLLSGKPLEANYAIEPLKKDLNSISGKSNKSGNFITSLPTNYGYAFFVEKEGYVLHSGKFSLGGIQNVTDPFIIEIQLKPIPKTDDNIAPVRYDPIVLNNIFFETGSALLKLESDIEISRLADNMKLNESLKIVIHGHTDNIGSVEDNMLLSEERAKSVMQALIDKGILASRISSRGFGESTPIDNNEIEEGRKNNRRTEFVVK
jgi:outer membrane protein OmpA-like peptidoglycan-associated protein/tetratricopeptide (TPR) repeat protein